MLRIVLALTVASFLALAGDARAASPHSTGKTKVLCDDSIAQLTASVTITPPAPAIAKIRISGKNFPADTALECGYRCAVGGVTPVPITCGSTDEKGKFTVKVEFVADTCVGLIPFARTTTPGPSCILTVP